MKIACIAAEDIAPGFAYVIAYLKQQGHDVKLFFAPRQFARGYAQNGVLASILNTDNHIIRKITTFAPDQCLFSPVTATYQYSLHMAERIKKTINTKVIFGGVHATLVPEEVRKHSFIDEVVVGDGIEYFGGKFDPDKLWPDREIFLKELPPVHRKYQIFMTSIGCPFNCSYCLPKGTPVLTKDLQWKNIEDIVIGEDVVSIQAQKGKYSKIITSKVMNKFSRKSELIRIVLEDGGILYSTPEHPWLTIHNRWRKAENLKVGWYLRRISTPVKNSNIDTEDYKKGWLQGMREGDGFFAQRTIRGNKFWRFQLACDFEALDIFKKFCDDLGIAVRHRKFNGGKIFKNLNRSIVCEDKVNCLKLKEIFDMEINNDERARGYLAGIYDAEGSWSCNVLRICNEDEELKLKVCSLLKQYGFKFSISPVAINILGGRSEHIRFVSFINSKVPHRKTDYLGKGLCQKVKILSINKVNGEHEVYNLQTEAENFTAWGIVTHNCGNEQMRKVGNFKFIKRSVEGCIEELHNLKNFHGMKYVLFVDDILTADKKWLMEFMTTYKRVIDLPFCCFAHPKFLDEDIVKSLKDGGCHSIWIGIQTGDEGLRKKILNRPESNKEIVDSCAIVKKHGIKLIVDHIFGIPSESAMSNDISQNLYTIIKPDIVNCYHLLYFPKAKIIEHAIAHGCLTPAQVQDIEQGKGAVYQLTSKEDYYNQYAKTFCAIPIGGLISEIMPMWMIKLVAYLKAGRGFIPLAMIQNEVYFTLKSIWRKLC
jgi:hypothetical protein